jgi:predicted Zn finger-like uncharacterized protein
VIVTCEKCSTQFQLDDSRVPQGGAKVRCSRCKHAFRVMPEGAAADAAGDSGRRAKGESDTKEITQDPPGRKQAARSAPSQPEAERSLSGVENEESDWRFNDENGRSFTRREAAEEKPEPPAVAAPINSRLGDEWFSGGSDAPLELDDRPRGHAAEPEPAPAPAPPHEPPRPAVREAAPPVEEPSFDTPSIDTPVADPHPSAQIPDFEAEPSFDETPEPSFDAAFEGDLGGEPQEKLPFVDRRAAKEESDELGGDTWDLLAGAEEDAAEPASEQPAKRPRVRGPSFDFSGIADKLVVFTGQAGNLLGWAAATALFGYGLYAGLAPQAPTPVKQGDVAGLEVTSLDSRMVENVAQGTLWVVSGRVRNQGSGAAELGSLALELLDRRGEPLISDRVALHAPMSRTALREGTGSLEAPPLTGRVGPGEERSFEAVLASLPPEAAAFRLVAGGR